MRLLLDTHVWLWVLQERDRLSESAADLISDPENELWLSSISVWEAMLLHGAGRLGGGTDARDWLDRASAALPVRDLPINRDIAFRSRIIDLPHQDPADRIIAATAAVNELILVSADRQLLESTEIETLPAT